ncbi:MAG TPA: hypothetical protein PK788_14640, partial [Gemmatimonadaceae bacterium]|nr:hypothetical protein [Gemmatimonadaceae bacterium]
MRKPDYRLAVTAIVLAGLGLFYVVRSAVLQRRVNELVVKAAVLEEASDSLSKVDLTMRDSLAKVERRRVADSVAAAVAIAKRDSIIRHTPIPPVDTFTFDSARYVPLVQHVAVVDAYRARAKADADALAASERSAKRERESRILNEGLYRTAKQGWDTERARADMLEKAVEAAQCRFLVWDCPSRTVVGVASLA